jgi:predicted DsbA family dithiol-disulfide isomerase
VDATRDTVVDFWFDPVCPYSWTGSRWLHEVGRRRQLRVRHHVVSLHLLNRDRPDVAQEYRRNVEASRGPPKSPRRWRRGAGRRH